LGEISGAYSRLHAIADQIDGDGASMAAFEVLHIGIFGEHLRYSS
jgi:hypothetical protein